MREDSMRDVAQIGKRLAKACLQPLRGHGIRRRLGLYRPPELASSPPPEPWRPPPAPDDALDRIAALADARDGAALEGEIARLDPARYYDLSVLVAGIAVKTAGFWELALRVFNAQIAADPGYMPAHYERALVLRHFGRLSEAVEALYEARRCKPDDFRAGLLLTQLLYAVAPEEAAAAAALVPCADEAESRQLARAALEGDYLTEFPRERARVLIGEVRSRYEWLDTPLVAQAIHDALDARTGFALIRLGDGEGAFVEVDAADEARHAELYAIYRREWTTFLLGESFDPRATGYDALTRTLMATACEADLVGIPYMSWIDHEYDIVSPRTITCLMNVHRKLLADPPERKPRVCDQLMHMHLFTSGLIEPIIRKARRVSIVTCLPDLPDLLQRRFGLEEVALHLVPSEVDAPHLRSDKPAVGDHFPHVFHDMIERLSHPHDGRLFLIAAGTFGKFYAAVIKRHGGVALDVGSLVDAWMRLPSRIGYDESLAL